MLTKSYKPEQSTFDLKLEANKITALDNPLPHMPILGSSNSAANKDMMS